MSTLERTLIILANVEVINLLGGGGGGGGGSIFLLLAHDWWGLFAAQRPGSLQETHCSMYMVCYQATMLVKLGNVDHRGSN